MQNAEVDEKAIPVSKAKATPDAANNIAKLKKKVASVVPLPVKEVKPPRKNKNGLLGFLIFKGLRPQQLRRRILILSFALFVAAPSVLGTMYFLFIASDRYSSTVGFAVRGMDGSSAGGDFLGALTGLASVGTTTTDSYILMDYLKSREVVERLNRDMDLKTKFSNDKIDYFYRLDPLVSIEDFVAYWSGMINTTFDNTSSIMSVEAEAFSASDAENIADLLLSYSSELVNKLSMSARDDAVKFAKEEVSRAELRLRMIRGRVRKFRASENSLDPMKNAEIQIELVAGLEKQLIDTRSRLATLAGTIDESSPTIRQQARQGGR